MIVALSEKSRSHIPYRNSMMTSVLRDRYIVHSVCVCFCNVWVCTCVGCICVCVCLGIIFTVCSQFRRKLYDINDSNTFNRKE